LIFATCEFKLNLNIKASSSKRGIYELAEICAARGVKYAVLSPGSRCAPLILAFARNKTIRCFSIIDERSAGFFALGIAKATQTPVVLVCTSGSALLNYGPAIAEAFYSDVPLLIISADRPEEYIDIQDGQSIRQFEVFRNFVKFSCQLRGEINSEEEFRINEEILHHAIDSGLLPNCGPVHVNIPFHEPLYQLAEKQFLLRQHSMKATAIEKHENEVLSEIKFTGKKVMVIAGQSNGSGNLVLILEQFCKRFNWVVLTESLSNLQSDLFISNFNDVLAFADKEGIEKLLPDVMITFGNGIVSKSLKKLLRIRKPLKHIHIDKAGRNIDTYFSLSKVVCSEPYDFFKTVYEELNLEVEQQFFYQNWRNFSNVTEHRKNEILSTSAYSDLKAFEKVIQKIPGNSHLHFANSMAVRYGNLFADKIKPGIQIFSNRGVSGIDGCVSTAVGNAVVTSSLVFLITGDLAYQYDSNALWNQYTGKNLRIIILNNSGGGIFYFVDGTDAIPELEEWFVTKNANTAKFKAIEYGLDYFECFDLKGIDDIWPDFTADNGKSKILEIFTDSNQSSEVYKSYLKQLKTII
jgi:2-succinyl-5-enolpyruvyl-6-hydroxy-3-cyclohexene-1-carboxylate synthase